MVFLYLAVFSQYYFLRDRAQKRLFFFRFLLKKKIRLHMHHRIKSKNPLKIGFSSKKVSLTGYELIQEKCQISNKVPFFKMKV